MYTKFRVRLGLVDILDRFAKKHGSKNFASYLDSHPRSGISILELCTEFIMDNGGVSVLDVSVDQSVSEHDCDPERVKCLLDGLPANYDKLSSEYDGEIVEVKLERSIRGPKTIQVTVPAAK